MTAMIRRVALVMLVPVLGALMNATTADASAPTEITFTVESLHEPLTARTIRGTLSQPECSADTVVLLQHGLSYTRRAWDRPGYSVVQPLVDAGFDVVAIDRLGYGASTLPDGYNVSSESHASNTRQIVDTLRTTYGYDHVVIGGHSAGSETSTLAAGLFGAGDAVLALGYHHFPSQQIATDFITGDLVRAAQDDYEYFLGTPEHRAGMFYTAAADPAVIADDTANAVLTPSGEIFSIGKQPSRSVLSQVKVPVFLQLGDSDALFPVEFADEEATLFTQAPVTVDVVPAAGHTFMLHPTGPPGAGRMAAWVAERFPGCG